MTMLQPGMEPKARSIALSQWYTPPDLANKLWLWAAKHVDPWSVLEPAAGRGSLLRPIFAEPHNCESVVAIDIDAQNSEYLARNTRKLTTPQVAARCADFLRTVPILTYDLVLMSPPDDEGLDVAFIMHALRFAPVIVGIFRSAILHGDARFEELWQRVAVVRGAWLRRRPSCEPADYVVLQLAERPTKLVPGEAFGLSMEWW